jgi:hypothetical protein
MEQIKYVISVAEPWDFESPDGQNVIKGTILSKKSNQCLIFKSNHYLQFNDIKGNILILTPRYYGCDFSNFQNDTIAFNGSILLREYDEQLSENSLQENAKFVIIGAIKKRDETVS